MGNRNLRHMVSGGALYVVASVVVLIASLSGSASAVASTVNGSNGLRVSPVTTQVTINPGQTQTINVTVTNITASTANIQTIINDFTAAEDESGDPSIILGSDQYAPSHSLKRYATPPSGSIVLQPGEEKAVPVVISIPKNAAGGGYYGAIRFAPASSTSNSNVNVSLTGSVASLVLVKVPGNVKEQLSIASFDARVKDKPSTFFTSNKNITVTTRFQNEGNIQDAPFGKILLKNHSGKTLASYEINNVSPPGNVLPDSIRKFTIPLGNKLSSFGQYKLEGNFGYGSGGQLLSATTTFYVVPTSLIIGFVVAVLLIIFIIVVVPRLVRAYNRRILRKAGRR